jgi:hypothetical protein
MNTAEAADLEQLAHFRATHPDIPIMVRFRTPTAFVGYAKIQRPTLRALLDRLGELCGGPGD